MGSFDFPWEMYMEAAQQKGQNKMQTMQILGQALANAGQNVGQGLQQRGQQRAQQRAQQQLGQELSPTPGQAGPPTQGGVGPSDINWGNVISQGTKAGMNMEPIILQMYKSKNSQGLNPNTVAQMEMNKARMDVMKGKNEAWEKSIDARQVDNLAKSVSLTTNQRNILQQNNMRANRAIQIANDANTWQEFGAMVTDAAAIMQGGVPHVDQLNQMAYPSWKQDLARIQTYMTSSPQTTVPQEFKDRVINMMQGIQEVDNRYLQKNSEFMQKMIEPTIRGGERTRKPIKDITGTITETIPYKGGSQKFDPEKERRYREWKAQNGY